MIIILTAVLLVLYGGVILYYRLHWLRIPEPQQITAKPAPGPLPFVSIIIAARNEEENIGACIQSICEQTYPGSNWELIVMDDHSEDNTGAVVKSFENRNIRLVHLADHTTEKLNSFKKKSIEIGVHMAKGSLIVTTDADCIVPKGWLEGIAGCFLRTGSVFIAAPVAFLRPSKSSFWQKCLYVFQSLDFMTLQGITGASVSSRFHNMCNGANLAYTKDAFYAAGGFNGIDDIASGDDMLLMHKISKIHPDKLFYLKDAAAIVETRPALTLSEFLHQRIRWASKSNRYPDPKITSVLILVYLLNVWLLFLMVYAFFHHMVLQLLLGALAVKILVELFFLFPVAAFFRRKKLLWAFIPAQPFHILYTVFAGTLGSIGTYKWKGRRVK